MCAVGLYCSLHFYPLLSSPLYLCMHKYCVYYIDLELACHRLSPFASIPSETVSRSKLTEAQHSTSTSTSKSDFN